jgi:hypothetical protein
MSRMKQIRNEGTENLERRNNTGRSGKKKKSTGLIVNIHNIGGVQVQGLIVQGEGLLEVLLAVELVGLFFENESFVLFGSTGRGFFFRLFLLLAFLPLLKLLRYFVHVALLPSPRVSCGRALALLLSSSSLVVLVRASWRLLFPRASVFPSYAS